MKLTKEELKERAWYRILQVIFGLIVLLAVAILIYSWLQNKPIKISDPSKSTFTCTSGASDRVGQTYNLGGGGAYVESDGTLSNSDLEDVRYWCNDNEPIFSDQKVSYQLNIVFKTEPSWIRFVSSILIGLVALGIIFSIIRSLFLYIATGKSK